MGHPKPAPGICIATIVLTLLACAGSVPAQNPQARPGTLRGQVTDPSGASVANAAVKLTGPAGNVLARTTDANGAFEVTDLAPGNYSLAVSVAGFAPKEQAVQILAGQVQQLTVSLDVATQQQEITVAEVAPTVDASPANNAGAVVMSGNDLEALSDDPDQLQADLQALAGTGGPEGGQIFIDGFSGGTLPPKSSIREIRINQNPFAAEFDQLGFGRIEVLTKPGTDQLHGRLAVTGNNSSFNTKSPYVVAGNQTPNHGVIYEGNISGSIHRVASFALAALRRNIDDSAVVNAIVLDPAFNPVPFTAGVSTPQQWTNISPRLDYQLTRDNTFTVRYQFSRNVRINSNIGGFALPSQGVDGLTNEHLLQLIDSQVIGERAVNETRFQFIHNATQQIPLSPATAVRVTGAFTGGGSANGTVVTTTQNYEFQNGTSLISGPHILKFGGRVRAAQLVSSSTNNFNGTFTFASLTAYQLTVQGLAQGRTPAQIRANDGGPDQFSITAGQPRTPATLVDAGLYVQDDWKLRSNVTLSGGLRFETQNGIPDHSDFAPRIGLAWSFGKKNRPTVIRTGFGIFYNRFPINNVLALNRYNGMNQQQYFVTNPDFYPTIPAVTTLTGAQSAPTVYSLAPDLRSAYYMQWALTIERQLTRIANLSLNHFGFRGVHRAIQSNINVPLPGSITAANPTGTRPFPNQGNIYQYISASDYTGYYSYAALNIRAGAKLTLMGNYGVGWARANAVPGNGGFTSNPYNLNQDWGRAAGEVRQNLYFGGTIALPHAFRVSPFVIANSGAAFSITEGQDLNGDSIFNDRPGFVTSQTLPQNIVVTRYGNFDKAPAPGAPIIPIDSVRGPGRATVNLTLGRTFNLTKVPPRSATAAAGGPAGPDALKAAAGAPGGGPAFGPRRYTLTLNIAARNIFNKVNRGNPVGNLSSPLFGQVNSLAGGPFTTGAAVRRVDLQLVFAF